MLIQRYNVLSIEQCQYVIDTYRALLKPSLVLSRHGYRRSRQRTSSSHKFSDLRSDIAEALYFNLKAITGARKEQFEPWSLLHYAIGERFTQHSDFINPQKYKDYFALGGQRIYSAILYLSTVEAGGETYFPLLQENVTPEIGKLVVWPNVKNGQARPEATHEARPVTAGEKWALVTWVRENDWSGAKIL